MKRQISIRTLAYIICALLCFSTLGVQAKNKNTTSGTKAKELFLKVYDSVFGSQGSTLRYNVNIIGIYKTNGLIVYKGKKFHYSESRYKAWEDGVTAYMVDTKKKAVNIYRYDDDNKDNYLSKFKYDLSKFNYSYTSDDTYYYITAKVKDSSLFGIKSLVAKVTKTDLTPVSLKIKLGLFSTTVQISDFRSGNIGDSNFVFPKDKYKDYTFTDHRNEK